MVVRDGARHIEAALQSLAVQTFDDFEIVVVDDGSRDATRAILQKWRAIEPRLRLVHLDGCGLAAGLNKAAAVARAPILARLDADDIAHPERLAIQHRVLQRMPGVGLLGSAVELIDTDGRRVGQISVPEDDAGLRRRLRSGCCLVQSSVMMRRAAFDQAGGYRRGLNIAEDFDLWRRMAGVTRLAALPDKLSSLRLHPGSISVRRPLRGALAAICVVAAQEARRRCAPEPFKGGAPRVRAALAILGLSRAEFRRKVCISLLSQRVLHFYLRLPGPAKAKAGVRDLAMRLGLRPLYRFALKALVRLAPLRGAA
jgi:hypothetical protein